VAAQNSANTADAKAVTADAKAVAAQTTANNAKWDIDAVVYSLNAGTNTAVDPGVGKFAFNNTVVNVSTQIAINETDVRGNIFRVTRYAPGDILFFKTSVEGSGAAFKTRVTSIIDNGTWFQLNVITIVGSSLSLCNQPGTVWSQSIIGSALAYFSQITYTVNTIASLADMGINVRIGAAGLVTYSIDTVANTKWPPNAQINLTRTSSGLVTFVPLVGVSFQSKSGLVSIGPQYGAAVLTKAGAADIWSITGDLV